MSDKAGGAGRSLFEPHPSRLAPTHRHYAAIVEAHAVAVRAGEAGYIDPVTRLFVMTALNLVERGNCCEAGCRHCPYLT
jgi:hypothetical protein